MNSFLIQKSFNILLKTVHLVQNADTANHFLSYAQILNIFEFTKLGILHET